MRPPSSNSCNIQQQTRIAGSLGGQINNSRIIPDLTLSTAGRPLHFTKAIEQAVDDAPVADMAAFGLDVL